MIEVKLRDAGCRLSREATCWLSPDGAYDAYARLARETLFTGIDLKHPSVGRFAYRNLWNVCGFPIALTAA
jgi:hypothetical protein